MGCGSGQTHRGKAVCRADEFLKSRCRNTKQSNWIGRTKDAGAKEKANEYQRRWVVQQSGYDPDKFTLSDDDDYIILRQQQPVQLQPVAPPPANTLSRSEKDAIIRRRGLSPDDVDLDETGLLLIPKTKSNPNTPRQEQPAFQYVIDVTDPSGKETKYYSTNEPKAYGSGYKFKMFPTDIEITVSGSVRIMKLW